MKTDFIRFKELYLSFGVLELNHKTDEEGNIIIKLNGHGKNQRPQFDGYMGFYSEVTFDKDGKFTGQGFWEWK